MSRASLDTGPPKPDESLDGPTKRIDKLSWDTVERARAHLARNAASSDELIEWMHMLGIYPGQAYPVKTVDDNDPRLSSTHDR